MKNFVAILIALSTMLASCTQRENAILTNADLQELVEADLEMIVSTVEESGLISVNVEVLCGITGDSSITYTSNPGNFQMTAGWTWEVLCTDNVPSELDLQSTGSFSYNYSRITATSGLNGDLLLGNLISADNYILNGTVDSEADVTTRTQRTNRDFTSETTYTYQNIEFDRESYEIQSGTVQVGIKGDMDNGGSFDRTATLVFNGNNAATLTLDNGAVYTINW